LEIIWSKPSNNYLAVKPQTVCSLNIYPWLELGLHEGTNTLLNLQRWQVFLLNELVGVCLFCHLFLFSFLFPKSHTSELVPIGLQSLSDNIFKSCATQSLQNDTRTGAPFDSNKTVEKLFTSFLRETMALKSDVKDPLVMYIIMGTISL